MGIISDAGPAVQGFLQSLQEYIPLTADNLVSFLIGFALAAFVFTMLGRAAYALFRPFRTIIKIATSVLRRMRILPRLKATTSPARRAVIGARAVVRGAPSHMTETEWALSQPNDAFDAETGEVKDSSGQPLYDFAEEQKLMQESGAFFKSLDFAPEYVPTELSNPFSDEIADQYELEAARFFFERVMLDSNERSLYEDAEGAVFVSLFRNSDRRAYYALDRMRRVINGNAARLILFLGAIFVLSVGGMFAVAKTITADNLWVLGAISAFGVLLMFIFQNLMYAQQQRQNTRELASFLGRYLDRLSDRFRETSAAATRVIQGDERDAKVLASGAHKWLKIMIWLPFRAFFIESFVRGVNYQIRRNAGYYLFFGFVLSASTVAAFWWSASAIEDVAVRFWLMTGSVLLAIVYNFFIHLKVVMTELDHKRWIGYENLNVGKQMEAVIGKYAAEIAQWKGRFDR